VAAPRTWVSRWSAGCSRNRFVSRRHENDVRYGSLWSVNWAGGQHRAPTPWPQRGSTQICHLQRLQGTGEGACGTYWDGTGLAWRERTCVQNPEVVEDDGRPISTPEDKDLGPKGYTCTGSARCWRQALRLCSRRRKVRLAGSLPSRCLFRAVLLLPYLHKGPGAGHVASGAVGCPGGGHAEALAGSGVLAAGQRTSRRTLPRSDFASRAVPGAGARTVCVCVCVEQEACRLSQPSGKAGPAHAN
jgi:hypothetical protein